LFSSPSLIVTDFSGFSACPEVGKSILSTFSDKIREGSCSIELRTGPTPSLVFRMHESSAARNRLPSGLYSCRDQLRTPRSLCRAAGVHRPCRSGIPRVTHGGWRDSTIGSKEKNAEYRWPAHYSAIYLLYPSTSVVSSLLHTIFLCCLPLGLLYIL
jgi:hypothetical protein